MIENHIYRRALRINTNITRQSELLGYLCLADLL